MNPRDHRYVEHEYMCYECGRSVPCTLSIMQDRIDTHDDDYEHPTEEFCPYANPSKWEEV